MSTAAVRNQKIWQQMLLWVSFSLSRNLLVAALSIVAAGAHTGSCSSTCRSQSPFLRRRRRVKCRRWSTVQWKCAFFLLFIIHRRQITFPPDALLFLTIMLRLSWPFSLSWGKKRDTRLQIKVSRVQTKCPVKHLQHMKEKKLPVVSLPFSAWRETMLLSSFSIRYSFTFDSLTKQSARRHIAAQCHLTQDSLSPWRRHNGRLSNLQLDSSAFVHNSTMKLCMCGQDWPTCCNSVCACACMCAYLEGSTLMLMTGCAAQKRCDPD